MPAVP